MDRCRNGPGFHNDIDGNSTVQEILIPASKVGLVIGKGGETIKQLQVREPRPAGLVPPASWAGWAYPDSQLSPWFLQSTAVSWKFTVARPRARYRASSGST